MSERPGPHMGDPPEPAQKPAPDQNDDAKAADGCTAFIQVVFAWLVDGPRKAVGVACAFLLKRKVGRVIMGVAAAAVALEVGPRVVGMTSVGQLVLQRVYPLEFVLNCPRLPPPYGDVLLTARNLPRRFDKGCLKVRIEGRRVDVRKHVAFVGTHGEGTLTVKGAAFLADYDVLTEVELAIQYEEHKSVKHLDVAPRPDIGLRADEHAAPLDVQSRMLPSPVRQEILRQFKESDAPRRAFAICPVEACRIVLPDAVAAAPDAFALELDGRRLPDDCIRTDGGGVYAVLAPSDFSRPGRRRPGRHVLRLFCGDREMAACLLIHVCAPMFGGRDGDVWSLPEEKKEYWRHDPMQTPDQVCFHGKVAEDKKGNLKYFSLKFDRSSHEVQGGTYLTWLRFRETGGCSLSVPFTRDFEVVIPAGPGLKYCAFKLNGQLNWTTQSDQDMAITRWACAGRVLKLRKTDSEVQFRDRPFSVADNAWHSAALIVRIAPERVGEGATFHFRAYVDARLIGRLDRAARRLAAKYIPEFRNWGCPHLSVRSLRCICLPIGWLDISKRKRSGQKNLRHAGRRRAPVSRPHDARPRRLAACSEAVR